MPLTNRVRAELERTRDPKAFDQIRENIAKAKPKSESR
jgi:hypothetical protein